MLVVNEHCNMSQLLTSFQHTRKHKRENLELSLTCLITFKHLLKWLTLDAKSVNPNRVGSVYSDNRGNTSI